jgi:hypothetical protein
MGLLHNQMQPDVSPYKLMQPVMGPPLLNQMQPVMGLLHNQMKPVMQPVMGPHYTQMQPVMGLLYNQMQPVSYYYCYYLHE